jgi:outer membrane protein TolC
LFHLISNTPLDLHSMRLFKKKIHIVLYLCGFCLSVYGQDKNSKPVDLNYFIGQALSSSPLSKDYNNQLLANKIDSMRLKAGYLPLLTASSTGLYAPIINGYGYDEVITNGQSLDALLTVNYALIGNNQKNNQAQAVRLQRDSIHFASKLSELDLRKTITEQYITAYASQQQVEFNRDIYNLLKNEEALLLKLTRANTYTQTEYLTFLVTFKQQQLQYKQAELQFRNDFSVLNYLCGIIDTTTIKLKEPVLTRNVAELPLQSFFIKRFEIDSLKSMNERRSIAYNYKPKASVYVNGGYNSSFNLQPYKNFGTSAGFTVSVPIYDGHQKRLQYSKLDLKVQTSTAYRTFFLKQQQQQVNLLNQQINATEELYQQIRDQLKFTKGLIEVDSRLLHTGDVKITDFIIAVNNYMATQNLFRQTTINRLKLISQLNYWNR